MSANSTKQKKSVMLDRIEQTETCSLVNLTDSEKQVYKGAGWQITAFKNEELVSVHPLNDYAYISGESFDAEVRRATSHNTDKLKQLEADGFDCWLVMASGYQLCDPVRIASDDALSVAKIARIIGEEIT